jgi:hypothetical protein
MVCWLLGASASTVLANWLLQVAGDLADPAQCAFRQQRQTLPQVGDARLLQMLPAHLAAENSTAIAVFIANK